MFWAVLLNINFTKYPGKISLVPSLKLFFFIIETDRQIPLYWKRLHTKGCVASKIILPLFLSIHLTYNAARHCIEFRACNLHVLLKLTKCGILTSPSKFRAPNKYHVSTRFLNILNSFSLYCNVCVFCRVITSLRSRLCWFKTVVYSNLCNTVLQWRSSFFYIYGQGARG